MLEIGLRVVSLKAQLNMGKSYASPDGEMVYDPAGQVGKVTRIIRRNDREYFVVQYPDGSWCEVTDDNWRDMFDPAPGDTDSG